MARLGLRAAAPLTLGGAYAIDDSFFCPCDEAEVPGTFPTCSKPLTQFYLPEMLLPGKKVYPALYDLTPGQLWPHYESCPVYSPAGVQETRDIPQWLPNQLVSNVTVPEYAQVAQLHYCDKVAGQYVYCLNDPKDLAARQKLCEEQYGNVGVRGQTVHTIDNEGLMCSGDTCLVLAGEGRFGSVPAVLDFIKEHKKPYRRIRVVPFSQQFLKLILFNATTFDVMFTANYTTGTDQPNAFTANQRNLTQHVLFQRALTDDLCAGRFIGPVVDELRQYFDQLVQKDDSAFTDGINVVTADHDYPPDAEDFFASLTLEQAEGPYTENGAYVEAGFTIESYFPDLWPTFKLSGDTCVWPSWWSGRT